MGSDLTFWGHDIDAPALTAATQAGCDIAAVLQVNKDLREALLAAVSKQTKLWLAERLQQHIREEKQKHEKEVREATRTRALKKLTATEQRALGLLRDM